MRLQVLHLPSPDDGSDPKFALVIDRMLEPLIDSSQVRDRITAAAEYAGASGVLFFAEPVEVL